MALVKVDQGKNKDSWNNRNIRSVRHKIPADSAERPVIDYKKLKELCKIEGLKDRPDTQTTPEAHADFMQTYSSIFVPSKPKIGLPVHSEGRSSHTESDVTAKSLGGNTPQNSKQTVTSSNHGYRESHDIRDHLAKLHKQRKSENPVAVQADRIKTLRRLLRKLPFERTAAENDQLYQVLCTIPSLTGQFPQDTSILKELCVNVQIDIWKDPGITVFGNTGYHMILRGTVKPLSLPSFKSLQQNIIFRSQTPEPPEDIEELTVGDCFGTLKKVEGREANSRILAVMTTDANCEFLKITTSDYERVKEQINSRNQTEKVNLLQNCGTYKLWSRQPLIRVAELIKWVSYPANTVLVSEGFKSPFIGIMKSGECHVLRQVEVLDTLPNGKKERKTKQVVMGKLGQSESFGEISVILNEPITCSIVTASPVEMGIIEPQELTGLDEVTLQLLRQSSTRTYGNLSTEDIHNEYITQELKREWNEFKHSVVVDVINSKGIRPGYGKWSK